MKKTIKLIALLLITIIVITGCGMKEDISVTISADENVSIEAIVAFDDEMIDMMISTAKNESGDTVYTDEERWAYLESSDNTMTADHSTMYTETERYQDETFKGNKYKATNIKLTDLVKDNEEEIDFNGFVNENKLFTKNGNEYSIHLKSSQAESQEEPVQVNSDIDTEDIDQVLDLKFSITLPAPAKSNNATEVSEDKLTYSWDLLKTPAVDLVFEIPENTVKDEPKEEEKKITLVEWANASAWAEEELKTAQLTGIIPTSLEGKDFKVNITRKDFAAVSVKLYETITKTMSQVSINNPFTDTDDVFVLKAYDLGITTGTSATEFSPKTAEIAFASILSLNFVPVPCILM